MDRTKIKGSIKDGENLRYWKETLKEIVVLGWFFGECQ